MSWLASNERKRLIDSLKRILTFEIRILTTNEVVP